MKHDLTTRKYERRARKLYALFSCLVLALTVMVVPAFAADDPLTVVNNLSEFIFSLIRAIGLILLASASSNWACPSRAMTPPSGPMACSPSPVVS